MPELDLPIIHIRQDNGTWLNPVTGRMQVADPRAVIPETGATAQWVVRANSEGLDYYFNTETNAWGPPFSPKKFVAKRWDQAPVCW